MGVIRRGSDKVVTYPHEPAMAVQEKQLQQEEQQGAYPEATATSPLSTQKLQQKYIQNLSQFISHRVDWNISRITLFVGIASKIRCKLRFGF